MTEQRIKAAFDTVHADEALKQRTRAYLARTVNAGEKRRPLRRAIPALAACLLVLCLSGWYLYFIPTAYISVDINPSLELGVNRFDRVVSVEAYNPDGQALSDTLDLKYLDYRDALEQLVNDQAVEGYLQDIRLMDLGTYVTYNATEEEIAACGLDDPELTVTVDYADEDEEGNAVSGTFVLHISRDPEELAAAEESETAEDSEDTAGEDAAAEEEEEITAYARIGDSPILYQLAGADYEALMAASRDDLRHSEVLPADAADITQLAIVLDGETYTITSLTDGEERSYYYQEELLDMTNIQSALTALTADSFTRESPTEAEEIALTLTLDREGDPTVDIALYRWDGTYCLAEIDGEPVSLVERSLVVDLVEAVNAVVLG